MFIEVYFVLEGKEIWFTCASCWYFAWSSICHAKEHQNGIYCLKWIWKLFHIKCNRAQSLLMSTILFIHQLKTADWKIDSCDLKNRYLLSQVICIFKPQWLLLNDYCFAGIYTDISINMYIKILKSSLYFKTI